MENVGKRTPSDPMGTGCRWTSPSDYHVSVRKGLSKYTAYYCWGGGWKLSANELHRIRWRRVAVERVHRTATCQFARDLVYIQQSIDGGGVENVGKRTPSDPMETGCRGTSPSDCHVSVRERLSIHTAKYRWRRGGKCWQTDSIGSDGDGLPWNESIGLPHVSLRES